MLLDIVDIAALSVVNTIGHYFVRLIVLCFSVLFSTTLMVNKGVYIFLHSLLAAELQCN